MSKKRNRARARARMRKYRAEIERNARELAKHKWIRNPRRLAKIEADFKFGRFDRSKLIPLNIDELRNL